ncbi:MAG: DUF1592 domain-containing protein [Verrucomicrobiota bacterium]
MLRWWCMLFWFPVSLFGETGAPLNWNEANATFKRYCTSCHGGKLPDADLNLENIDYRADLEGDPEKWMGILQALRTHYMPHPDGREMPLEKRQPLIELIRQGLVEHAAAFDSHSATLRRLNRVEFNNTVNDLLFTKQNWAESLPADDAGYGFDNVAAALSFSPLLLERYFDAASRAASIAVPQRVEGKQWSLNAAEFKGGHGSGRARMVVSAGKKNGTRHLIFFPGKGTYELGLKVSAQQAGNENARVEFWFDGERLGEHEVQAKRKQKPEMKRHMVRVTRPGEHQLEVVFVNDFYKKTDKGKQDRNLIFHGVDLTGPVQKPDDLRSPFLDRYFGGIPGKLDHKELSDGIMRFASRAYRRPLTTEEARGLWEVFRQNAQSEGEAWDVLNGLYAAIDAVLTSPSFLFRLEGGEEMVREQRDSFALASWLSYFLWSSMPDERLFELARQDQLYENLESELQRMLADPKAVALAENFAGQWWSFRDLSFHKPDTEVYQGGDRELMRAMQQETRQFFTYVLKNDRPLLDFLGADYSFVNQRLARHYGIEGVEGKHFRKVSLQGTMRRGVWSQGGILTVTSHPNHTSPVLRGHWILENLIGLSPPPPPDNIPSLPGTEGKPDPADLRDSLAQHRENPDCASCHNIMDPIGLALEHFDGIGELRDESERQALKGETLFDGAVIKDPVDLATYFQERRSEDFVRNIARKLSTYAAGRGLDWQDEAALERITRQTRSQDYRFSALIQAVVNEFAPLPERASVIQVTSTTETP